MRFGRIDIDDCMKCGNKATHYIKGLFYHLTFCKKCWIKELEDQVDF